jgi:hypothetical protein
MDAMRDQLRADGTILLYDPASRTLRAGGHDALPVTMARPPLKLTRASTGKGGLPRGKEKEHPSRPEAERG